MLEVFPVPVQMLLGIDQTSFPGSPICFIITRALLRLERTMNLIRGREGGRDGGRKGGRNGATERGREGGMTVIHIF